MNKIVENRQFYTTTETSTEYVHPRVQCPLRPTRPYEICEATPLIAGSQLNNLHIDAKECVPHSAHEKYSNYAKKMTKACSWPPRLKPTSPNGEQEIANALYDRWHRSTYHFSYCERGDGPMTIKRIERDMLEGAEASAAKFPVKLTVETEYLEEYPPKATMAAYMDCIRNYRPIEHEAELKKELRRIFPFETTTYRAEVGDAWFVKKHFSYLDRHLKKLDE